MSLRANMQATEATVSLKLRTAAAWAIPGCDRQASIDHPRSTRDVARTLMIRQPGIAYRKEVKMKIDPASVAAVITAFAAMPVRMAAIERALTELTAKVEALLAASPPLLVPVTEQQPSSRRACRRCARG